MAPKVTADPLTRIITVTEAPNADGFVILDVQYDIYSRLKDDWQATPALQEMAFPFRSIGDPVNLSESIGPYAYFDNASGWRFLPYDADHTLVLEGNMPGEAAVLGLSIATFNTRPGRTINIRDSITAQALSSSATLDDPIEGGYTLRQLARGWTSALLAKLTGAPGPGTILARDLANAKTRISAPVDANGNRTVSPTLDLD